MSPAASTSDLVERPQAMVFESGENVHPRMKPEPTGTVVSGGIT